MPKLKVTKEQLKTLINELDGNSECVLDIDISGYDWDIYGIDFDVWENGVFKKTAFSIEKE